MKKIKIIFCILAIEIGAMYLLAEITHSASDYCFPSNNWHWYASQNDASAPSVINCPMIVPAQPAPASNASINEHHALQVLAVIIPLTVLYGLAESFRQRK